MFMLQMLYEQIIVFLSSKAFCHYGRFFSHECGIEISCVVGADGDATHAADANILVDGAGLININCTYEASLVRLSWQFLPNNIICLGTQ